MSAILSPMRLCPNPRLFSSHFGSQLNRLVPSLTRLVSSQGPSSKPSVGSEKDADLAAASTPPDSPPTIQFPETTSFNLVQTYSKTFKLLNGLQFSPDRHPVFTIHNFIAKPLIRREQKIIFKANEMPTDLYHELQKNWQYLGEESESSENTEKFIQKRCNKYANLQTRFDEQDDYFKSALRLKILFDLDLVILK